jgi:putative ABC transport system permease protein
MAREDAMLILLSLLRLYRRHPWLLLMSLCGLLLGSALVVAIDLLNQSARSNFLAARSQLAGEANYRVSSPPGALLDEALYVKLVRSLSGLDAMPQTRDWLKDEQGRSLQLLGMDLFNPGPLRALFSPQGQAQPQPDFSLTHQGENSVWLASTEASRLGWQVGETRRFDPFDEGKPPLPLTLAGTFAPGALPMEQLLITDIGIAQQLTGKGGHLDAILFKLDASQAAAVRALLPDPLWLAPISPALDASQLGDALGLNLSALSLLAMAVGLFLVFNAMSFVQSVRRPQLAQLLMLGATPYRLLRLLALELLLIALVGTGLGIGLGILLADALMGQVSRSLASLYGPNPIELLRLSPWVPLKAAGIGMGGALLAALPGWWQLLRQPALTLRDSPPQPARHTRWRRTTASGLLLLCGLCAVWPATGLLGALLMAAAWLLAMALWLPEGLRWLLALISHRANHRSPPWPLALRLALAETRYHLNRTAIALMALQLAIAAAIGIGVMVSSFRTSVELWLGQRLVADLYVSPPARGPGERGWFDADELARIQALPELAQLSRRSTNQAHIGSQAIEWVEMDLIPPIRQAYPLLAGSWPTKAHQVLASEPFANHFAASLGERLRVDTPSGPRMVQISGIYRDYSSDKGQLLLPFEQGQVQSLALFSTQPDALSQQLRILDPGAYLVAAPAIHRAALKVFDQTFVVTELLKLLILGIAFIGIASALMVLGLARAREFHTLQSLGFTAARCRRLLILQGAGLGLLTALLALPVGYGLAWILIEVVNPRAFGWTLRFEPAPLHAATALLMAPLTSALAAWLAARKAI